MRVRTIIAIVIIAVVGTVAVSTVSAQKSGNRVESPGITDVDIRATVNQSTQVVATYRVTMPSNEDQRRQWLNGTMWTFEETATENLSVFVDGRTVDPITKSNHRQNQLRIPAESSSDSDYCGYFRDSITDIAVSRCVTHMLCCHSGKDSQYSL